MSRHTARIHAMNLVFQLPFHPERSGDELCSAVEQYIADLPDLQEHLRGLTPDDEERGFISGQALGVFGRLAEIDGLIEERLRDWDFGRIAKIDLSLLRLAVFEMRYSDDVSTATAINEAVELAKLYGTEESPAFINGILGQIALVEAGP